MLGLERVEELGAHGGAPPFTHGWAEQMECFFPRSAMRSDGRAGRACCRPELVVQTLVDLDGEVDVTGCQRQEARAALAELMSTG